MYVYKIVLLETTLIFPDTNVLYFARQKGTFVRERLALWLYWIYNKYSTLITVHQYTWLIFILNLVCGFFYATTIYIFSHPCLFAPKAQKGKGRVCDRRGVFINQVSKLVNWPRARFAVLCKVIVLQYEFEISPPYWLFNPSSRNTSVFLKNDVYSLIIISLLFIIECPTLARTTQCLRILKSRKFNKFWVQLAALH